MLNKKILAAAVIGGLFAGNAAAADLSATPVVPAYYAKEIVATATAAVPLTTVAANQLSWKLGYNFSGGEVKYVRIKTSGKFSFTAAPTIEVFQADGITPVVGSGLVGAINGVGTDVITFSITSLDSLPTPLKSGYVIRVSGGAPVITGTDQDVVAEVALYDQASQAQNGGELGRVPTSAFSGAYITFVPSYELKTTALNEVANVESPDVAFTRFVDGAGNKVTGSFGTVTFGLRDPDGTTGSQLAPFKANGSEITMADLFGAATALRFDGDFSYTASAGATQFDAAAKARVQLGAVDLTTAGSTLTSNAAKFVVGATAQDAAVLNITTRPLNVIQETEYGVTLEPVAASPAYTVSGLSAKLGEITRNGTTLQAPLVQVPGGWVSRIALTNTGSVARPYSISVMTEEGATFQINSAKLTGSVPANGTKVIQLDDADLNLAAGSGRRGTFVVTVAGPNNQIQGLYQVVNPNNGLVNNHVLVRPGTN